MLQPSSGFPLVGGTFVLIGIITILRRKRISANWVRRMKFWTGRAEDKDLAEFDYATVGWAEIAFGIIIAAFEVFG